MSDIIQLLPDHVANQIAAGEVVQRPSSVVKELLENAIDAGATSIKLIVKDSGRTLVQVIDNGKGMSVTDARLCFERHATSKIQKAEDLFNLQTKGFRGEALASIAAIAHVELKTKQETEELGTLIKIEGSAVTSQESVSASTGTSLSVKNLFYNIPARRNFLKSNTVETRHIVNEFQRVSLAHPSIAFSFHHNDSEIYVLPKGNLRQRIVSILGKKTNEKLVPISEATDVVEITGFVAKPEFAKKKRGEQFFFVNDRFIKNAYLNHAVTSAFEGLISNGHFPTYFLFLNVPAKSIDINIHPTKTEIKFDDEKTLYAILRSTIKHSLGQYNVAPVLDFNRDAQLDTPYNFKNKTAPSTPKVSVNPDFNPFKAETTSKPYTPKPFKKEEANWDSLYTGLDVEKIEVEAEPVLNQLFTEEKTVNKTYQIHSKYIVSSIKSGIVYIHQNLAHQRILYEEFLENITVKDAMSQQLLFPLEINFSATDIDLIKEIKEDLESVGFLFDTITNETIVIKGIPVNITESQTTIIIEQLLDDIKNDIPDTSFSQLDIMAKSLAKSLAIKTGTKLDAKEQEEIVNNLFLTKQPDLSPFGKKTFVTVNIDEIDKRFNN
ncbi:DNA mismatch repair protein MutL [Lutibacter oricola]|uniref:DNA mismatch repair protein MutL n=1 Tax=Lutibacter oricola TaxID=762486 RepID=A0A1H3F047_9FLAO|nr:DNA mismatch repair endonuclease MutL [Lutibacter oricola]SDX84413.1 DNA mismatch repair protein MutL [Lutibacter oricola]